MPQQTYADPNGRQVTVSFPDGAPPPDENALHALFAQKYGNAYSPTASNIHKGQPVQPASTGPSFLEKTADFLSGGPSRQPVSRDLGNADFSSISNQRLGPKPLTNDQRYGGTADADESRALSMPAPPIVRTDLPWWHGANVLNPADAIEQAPSNPVMSPVLANAKQAQEDLTLKALEMIPALTVGGVAGQAAGGLADSLLPEALGTLRPLASGAISAIGSGVGAAGTSIAQSTYNRGVDPTGAYKAYQARLPLEESLYPLANAASDVAPFFVPQPHFGPTGASLTMANPFSTDIGGRATNAAIGAGLDVGQRVATGQPQDLMSTAQNAFLGFMAGAHDEAPTDINTWAAKPFSRMAAPQAETLAKSFLHPDGSINTDSPIMTQADPSVAKYFGGVKDFATLKDAIGNAFTPLSADPATHADMLDTAAKYIERRARGTAAQSGMPVEEWYKQNIPGLIRGTMVEAQGFADDFNNNPDNFKGITDPKAIQDAQRKPELFAAAAVQPNRVAIDQATGETTLLPEGAPLPEGKMQPETAMRVIMALNKPDVSDIPHEFEHIWLDSVRSDPALSQDAAVIDDYLGAKPGEPLTEAQHEKWAQTVSRIPISSDAPAKGISPIVDKMRDWMSDIYQTIAGSKQADKIAGRVPQAVIDVLAKHTGDISDLGGGKAEARGVQTPEGGNARPIPLNPGAVRAGGDTGGGGGTADVEANANVPQSTEVHMLVDGRLQSRKLPPEAVARWNDQLARYRAQKTEIAKMPDTAERSVANAQADAAHNGAQRQIAGIPSESDVKAQQKVDATGQKAAGKAQKKAEDDYQRQLAVHQAKEEGYAKQEANRAQTAAQVHQQRINGFGARAKVTPAQLDAFNRAHETFVTKEQGRQESARIRAEQRQAAFEARTGRKIGEAPGAPTPEPATVSRETPKAAEPANTPVKVQERVETPLVKPNDNTLTPLQERTLIQNRKTVYNLDWTPAEKQQLRNAFVNRDILGVDEHDGPIIPANNLSDAHANDARVEVAHQHGWQPQTERGAALLESMRDSRMQAKPETLPQPETSKAREADKVTGFTTAKGSTYEVHEDGTTTRNKAARSDVGHEGDSGFKQRSGHTVYLTDEESGRLGRIQAEGKQPGTRILISDDGKQVVIGHPDPVTGKWILDKNSLVTPSREPSDGLTPLEIRMREDGKQETHFGNKITEVRRGADNAQYEIESEKTAEKYVADRSVPIPEAARRVLATYGHEGDFELRKQLEQYIKGARDRMDRGVSDTEFKNQFGKIEEELLAHNKETGDVRVRSRFDEQSTIAPQDAMAQKLNYYPHLDQSKFEAQPPTDPANPHLWQQDPVKIGLDDWRSKQPKEYQDALRLAQDLKKYPKAGEFKAQHPEFASRAAAERSARQTLTEKFPQPDNQALVDRANELQPHKDAVMSAIEKGYAVPPKAAREYPEARRALQREYDLNYKTGTSNDPDTIRMNGRAGDPFFHGEPLDSNGVNRNLEENGIPLAVMPKQIEGARTLVERAGDDAGPRPENALFSYRGDRPNGDKTADDDTQDNPALDRFRNGPDRTPGAGDDKPPVRGTTFNSADHALFSYRGNRPTGTPGATPVTSAGREKQSALETGLSLAKAGLVSNPVIPLQIAAKNATLGVTEEAARVPASIADSIRAGVANKLTDKTAWGRTLGTNREVQGLSFRNWASASLNAAKSLPKSGELLKTGKVTNDLLDTGQGFGGTHEANSKYDILHKTVDPVINTIFRSHAASNRIGQVYAFNRSISAQADLIARSEKNANPNVDVAQRADELIQKPTAPMKAMALKDALVATMQGENALSKGVNEFSDRFNPDSKELASLKHALEVSKQVAPHDTVAHNAIQRQIDKFRPNPLGYAVAKTAVPITKLAYNAAAMTGQYHPLGALGKVVYEHGIRQIAPDLKIHQANIDAENAYRANQTAQNQALMKAAALRLNDLTFTGEARRNMAMTIGRGLVGTALWAIAAAHQKQGTITGMNVNDNDYKLRDQSGIPANSMLISTPFGRRWINLSTLGPPAAMLSAGATYAEQEARNDPDAPAASNFVKDVIASSAGQFADVPLLGDGAESRLMEHGYDHIWNNIGKNIAGFVIPGIVAAGATALDNGQERNTSGVPLGAMQARIPGLRGTLPPRDTPPLGPLSVLDPLKSRPFTGELNDPQLFAPHGRSLGNGLSLPSLRFPSLPR